MNKIRNVLKMKIILRCKLQLEEMHKIKSNGIKIASKWDWYEHGEKSSKLLLNVEKKSLRSESNL